DIVILCFQAEDGIRDDLVTGVQTCALPISPVRVRAPPCMAIWLLVAVLLLRMVVRPLAVTTPLLPIVSVCAFAFAVPTFMMLLKIGRASCREREKGVELDVAEGESRVMAAG